MMNEGVFNFAGGFSRADECAKVMHIITGEKYDTCVNIVLSTPTGQAMIRNNPCVLYEQTTDNIHDIVKELRESVKYTKIVDALSTSLENGTLSKVYLTADSVSVMTEKTKFKRVPELLQIQRKRNITANKKRLAALKQKKRESFWRGNFAAFES